MVIVSKYDIDMEQWRKSGPGVERLTPDPKIAGSNQPGAGIFCDFFYPHEDTSIWLVTQEADSNVFP